jgi:hypothetical protein
MKMKLLVCYTLFAIIGCNSGSERYKGNGFSIEMIPDAKMNTREDYVSFIVCNEDKTRIGSVDAGRKRISRIGFSGAGTGSASARIVSLWVEC